MGRFLTAGTLVPSVLGGARDLEPLTIEILGARPFDHRTGLWPSDHAGVVATAKPPRGMWGHEDE